MTQKQRAYVNRQERFSAKPSLYSCAVAYSTLGNEKQPRWAKYADISESGMRIVSNHPHRMAVGEIVVLKFSLAGWDQEITKRARVVRQANEYVLGLQFLNHTDDFKSVLNEHSRYRQRLPWTQLFSGVLNWWEKYRIGVRVALAGFVFFALTSTVIYLFSDDHAGRNRSWGRSYPNQIDYEYVDKFNH